MIEKGSIVKLINDNPYPRFVKEINPLIVNEIYEVYAVNYEKHLIELCVDPAGTIRSLSDFEEVA